MSALDENAARLQQRLAALLADWTSDMRSRAAYRAMLVQVEKARIVRSALQPGDTFPQVLLPDGWGRLVSSLDLATKGSFVVTFVRGSWCPFCTEMMKALVVAAPFITARAANLVVITSETGGRAAAAARRLKLNYELLVDVDNVLALQTGLVYRVPTEYLDILADSGVDMAAIQGNDAHLLPVPATYIVNADHIIQRSFIELHFARRITPAEIVAHLQLS